MIVVVEVAGHSDTIHTEDYVDVKILLNKTFIAECLFQTSRTCDNSRFLILLRSFGIGQYYVDHLKHRFVVRILFCQRYKVGRLIEEMHQLGVL